MPNLRRATNRLKDPRDLWLFLRIFFTLILLPRLIRRKRLPDILAMLDPGQPSGQRDEEKLLKTVGFVDTLLEYRILQRYGKCMLRSMALFKLLRQQGWPVVIHFGVHRKEENEPAIEGHSWLEMDGRLFLETSEEQKYITTYFYPPDSGM